MCVCVCVCVCMYIYIYTHTHTHTRLRVNPAGSSLISFPPERGLTEICYHDDAVYPRELAFTRCRHDPYCMVQGIQKGG